MADGRQGGTVRGPVALDGPDQGCPGGGVEHRGHLVAHQQTWAQHQGPGEAGTLQPAVADLVRPRGEQVGGEADGGDQLGGPGVAGEQSEQGGGRHGLAAAALPDQGQARAGRDVEARVGDGGDAAPARHEEPHGQSAHGQHGVMDCVQQDRRAARTRVARRSLQRFSVALRPGSG